MNGSGSILAWSSTRIPATASPAGAAALVLVLGCLAALLARLLATRTLESAPFRRMLERSGVTEFLRKGDVRYAPPALFGLLVFWIILLGALVRALHLMGVEVVRILAGRVQEAVPATVTALSVAVLGYVAVAFTANVVRTLARNAAVPWADILGRAIKWAGGFLVAGIAIEQLGVEFRLLGATYLIVLGAAAFGAALAFGLGCQEMARDAMQRFVRRLKEQTRDRGPDLEG